MHCRHRWLLVAGLLVLAAQSVPAQEAKQGAPRNQAARVDLHGDPLPAGALARLGSVRFHHEGGVIAAAFSPDGKTILAGGLEDKGLSLRFWETASGKELARFHVDGAELSGLAFTLDGQGVLVNRRAKVELYDGATGKLQRSFGDQNSCAAFALSPDGTMLATHAQLAEFDNLIHLWDLATGQEVGRLEKQSGQLVALRFSKNGDRLMTATSLVQYTQNNLPKMHPGSVCIWDVAKCKKLHELANMAHFAALARDGQTAAVSANDGEIHVVDVATGQARCKIPATGPFLEFTPDGKALVTSSQYASPILWDAVTGKEIREFHDQPGMNNRLVGFSADGKMLAVMKGNWQVDGSVLLWNVATGEPINHSGGHIDTVTSVAFSPGGKVLASGSKDTTVRLWDPSTSKELAKLVGHKGGILAVAFAPDGKTLASTSSDGTTRLWEVPGGRPLATLDGPKAGGPGFFLDRAEGTTALAFSLDGKTLVAGGLGGTVQVWELVGTKRSHTFSIGPDGLVFAIGRDARTALSANGEIRDDLSTEKLRLWSTTTGQLVLDIALRVKDKQTYDHMTCWTAAISGDDRILASTHSRVSETLRGTMYADHTIRLMERITGQEILSIKGPKVYALAFSPDSRVLACGHGNNLGFHHRVVDRDITLWNTLTGENLHTLKGHSNEIACLAFAPDGKRLASGSADHTILIWEDLRVPQDSPVVDKVTDNQLEDWWKDFGSDAAAAHQATARALQFPQQVVPMIRNKLKPAPAVDGKRIEELIKELDNPRYLERQQAAAALEELADLAELALRKTLAGNPSLECRRRVELLLQRIEKTPTVGPQLRVLRALAVLEWMSNPQAREVLAAIAKGAPQARQTRLAQDALDRLARLPK
jgi:WD40 repeat protein